MTVVADAARDQARDRQQPGPRPRHASTSGPGGSSPSASRTTSSRAPPARRSRRSTSSTACPRRPASSSSRSRHDHHLEPPVPASSTDLPPVERRAAIPAGFRAGGLAAGIKASGRPDLAVVVTTAGPAAVAAVFTPNAFAAAPVRLSRAHLAATSGDPRGGFGWAERGHLDERLRRMRRPAPAGDADQARDRARCSRRRPGVEVERTLHLSTGIIGTRLPLDEGRATGWRRSSRRSPRPTTGCWPPRGAAHDRFGDQGRDDDGRAARRRRPAGAGHASAASPRASG